MNNFIDSINTAFRKNEMHNTFNETLSDIQLMFNICEKVNDLFPDPDFDFLGIFVRELNNTVVSYRSNIEEYVNKKISEVSDSQTE